MKMIRLFFLLALCCACSCTSAQVKEYKLKGVKEYD